MIITTTTVCVPVELPSYDSIYNLIKDINIPFDPKLPGLPKFALPSVPTPMFPSLSMPDFQKTVLATELLVAQFFNWIKAAFDPIISFLGIAFEFPKIPVLNLSLPDLVMPNFDITALLAHLPNFSVPMLPDPIFSGMKIPEIEALAKVQALIQAYMGTLLTALTSLISAVVDKLGKKPFRFNIAMPQIPTLPTSFDDLMLPIYALLGVADLHSLLAKLKNPNFSLAALMSGISLPGFPNLNLLVPDPMFGKFANPHLSIMQMSKNLYAAMANAALTIVKQFCDAVKRFISFSFPKICIPVPTIVI